MKPVEARPELLRFSGAADHDPAVDAWLNAVPAAQQPPDSGQA